MRVRALTLVNMRACRARARSSLFIPRTPQQLQELHGTLKHHADEHFSSFLLGFSLLYALLQTYCIPGSVVLSVLAGSLFGFGYGFVVVSLVATLGACNCYWIARLAGRDFVRQRFAARVCQLDGLLTSARDNLFGLVLFLRLTPIVPNWAINIVSPVFPVLPFTTFALGTLLGMMPATGIYVLAGTDLAKLDSLGAIASSRSIGALAVLGCISLLVRPCLRISR